MRSSWLFPAPFRIEHDSLNVGPDSGYEASARAVPPCIAVNLQEIEHTILVCTFIVQKAIGFSIESMLREHVPSSVRKRA